MTETEELRKIIEELAKRVAAIEKEFAEEKSRKAKSPYA